MKTLSWGLQGVIPDDAVAAWGARAICSRGVLDIVPDRRDADFGEPEVKKAFVDWLHTTGIDWLEQTAKIADGRSREMHQLDDGPYRIRASTNASHGYLYISAWKEKNETTT